MPTVSPPGSGGGPQDSPWVMPGPGLEPGGDLSPPHARFSGCQEAQAFSPCVLDGADSWDSDGVVVEWEWTVGGGGQPTAGAIVPYAFDSKGTFPVTLTVTDDEGLEDSITQEITVGEGEDAAWLILLFMNGDNDLEDAALEDVAEMEAVGSQPGMTLVAQLDRSKGRSTAQGDWWGGRRLLVRSAVEGGSVVMDVLDEVDMGDPATAAAFGSWGITHQPADRVMFIFWDHGDGWSVAAQGESDISQLPATKGISFDESSGNSISVAEGELAQALSGIVAARGAPLDVLGFDACLMQMAEVGWASSPFALSLLASQDYETADGWPYDAWLADLAKNPVMDGFLLGEKVADAHVAQGDSALSVVDLGALPQVWEAMNHLAEASLLASPQDLALLGEAVADVTAFDWQIRDLGDFALAAGNSDDSGLAETGFSLQLAVAEAVVAERHAGWLTGATGLSVYLPSQGEMDPRYPVAPWSVSGSWDDMISALLGEL